MTTTDTPSSEQLSAWLGYDAAEIDGERFEHGTPIEELPPLTYKSAAFLDGYRDFLDDGTHDDETTALLRERLDATRERA